MLTTKELQCRELLFRLPLCCFFQDWNHLERSTHYVNSVFHFHGPLSREYLAFPHNFSNTSVWYFFLQSFATKAVVYNSWLCLLRQSLYHKCLSTDIASTKGHCSLENSMPNGSGLPGIRKRLSGSAELCTQYFVLFCFILIGSDGPNICRTPLSPVWDEVISSTFHQGMEPVQISVKAYIIPWLYGRLV